MKIKNMFNIKEAWITIAKSEATPIDILEKLANKLELPNYSIDNFRSVAVALLGNPNTPTLIRDRLQEKLTLPRNPQGQYQDWDMRLALAFNSSIPEKKREEYFQELVANAINTHEKLAARNSKTPPHILEQLAVLAVDKIDNSSVNRYLARNPSTPVHVLREFANDSTRYICQDVCKNSACPPDILVKLANKSEGIKAPSIYNSRTHQWEDWGLFWFDYPNMPFLELYRIQLSKEIEFDNKKAEGFIINNFANVCQFQEYLARHGDTSSRVALASRTNTPVHVLEQLIKDDNAVVRKVASENDNLPLNYLLKLTEDDDVDIRLNLVTPRWTRENIPVEILEALANDEAEEVREKIASYRNTPAHILIELANDSSYKVKSKVVSNRNTPVEIIERLWRECKLFDPENHNTPSHVIREIISHKYDEKTLEKFLKSSLGSYAKIPTETLDKLATHRSSVIRSGVAEHPNTSISVLESLADDNYCVTRWWLASNCNTPAHTLEHLLQKWESPEGKLDDELCRRLAWNKNSPCTVLEHLAQIQDFSIRQEILSNPNTPASTLVKLAIEEADADVFNYLRRNTNLNQESARTIAENLAQNLNVKTRLHVIETPYLSLETWIKLSRDESPEVRKKIASSSNNVTSIETLGTYTVIEHPHLPLEIWEELTKDSEIEVRQAIACNGNAPVIILELLAEDEAADVRQPLILYNSNIPVHILEKLAKDISYNVRQAVAAHSNTPVNILEQLAQDENVTIIKALIKNSNTPTKLRKELQYRQHENINFTLRSLSRIYNPKTDDLSITLSEYTQSSAPFVRLVSLMHPLVPVEYLQQASQSLLWLERYAVAINPSTPKKLRQQLLNDSNRVIRAAAKANLSN